MRLAADIETNGLLDDVSKFHCAVAIDVDTDEVYRYRPRQMDAFIDLIEKADLAIFHNGIKYDHPALEKLSKRKVRKDNQYDTLVVSRLIYSNLAEKDIPLNNRHKKLARLRSNLQHAKKETDRRRAEMGINQIEGRPVLPPKLRGSHSLKAWGYRLKKFKDEFGEQTDWQEFSEEMLDYCEQDCVVTKELFHLLDRKRYSPAAISLEHEIAWLMARQERNGFKFDVEKAERLESELRSEYVEIEQKLKDTFGTWYEKVTEKTPKKTIRYRKDVLKADRHEGATFTEVRLVEFNPSSRDQIAKVLMEWYGWEPSVFTETGKPKVDETTLASLEFPEAKLIVDYLTLGKRLGQLADGNQAWLKAVTKDGFIHWAVNTNAAVTGRATHSHPNVAQVPSVKVKKGEDGNKHIVYGKAGGWGAECRELFTVPSGWLLFGSDASGLELRCLGHFMARWDEGTYIKEILEGDIHTANQDAAGLDDREMAKTFIYAFLYGAGDEKVGSIVEPNASVQKKRAAGKKLKEKFLSNTPALKNLRQAVSKACEKGYLKGLDGRHLTIRSEHAALNTLLQSAGALICKKWCVEIERIAQERGLSHGWDGDYVFCAWVHDEVQIAVRNEKIGHTMGEVTQEAMKATESFFNFRCPLDCEYDLGSTWKETH